MEFNVAYNAHCSLRLVSGREIILDKLIQSLTYSGLLEGTPNKKCNDLYIEWTRDSIRKDPNSFGEPLLIEPERRDFLRIPGDMQTVLDRQNDRPTELKHIPEWLPLIGCIGKFHSMSPTRDQTKDASSLTIVWFQDDFGMDQRAFDRLRSIDWDRHAVDWDF